MSSNLDGMDLSRTYDLIHQPRIPGYEIIEPEPLGKGSYARVWLAKQVGTEIRVAIKVLHDDLARNPTVRRRFEEEAETLCALKGPNIVSLHQAVVNEHGAYFVMEYLAGGTLAQLRVRQGGRLELIEAAGQVNLIARAAHFAHERGVIHRDIKPSNVMYGERFDQPLHDFTPKLCDFGIARGVREAGETVTLSGAHLGTPAYMAPEQITARFPIDRRADIYALGVILYELVTGHLPFVGNVEQLTNDVQKAEPINPKVFLPDLPPALETIILTCLEKVPNRRYRTAEALANDLVRFHKDEPIQARRPGTLGRILRWAYDNYWQSIAVTFAVTSVMLVVGAFIGAREMAWAAERRLNVAEREAERQVVAAKQEGLELKLVANVEWFRATAARLRDRGDHRGHVLALDRLLLLDPPDTVELQVERARSLFACNDLVRCREAIEQLKRHDDRAPLLLLRAEEALIDPARQFEGHRFLKMSLDRGLSATDASYALALSQPPGRQVAALREVLRMDRHHHAAARCLPVALLAIGDVSEARHRAADLRLAFRHDPLPYLVEAFAAVVESEPVTEESLADLAQLTSRDHVVAVHAFLDRLRVVLRAVEAFGMNDFMAAWHAAALTGQIAALQAAAGPAFEPVAVPVPVVGLLFDTGRRVLAAYSISLRCHRGDEATLRKAVADVRSLSDGCPEAILPAIEVALRSQLAGKFSIKKADKVAALEELEELVRTADRAISAPSLVPRSPFRPTISAFACLFDLILLQCRPEPMAGQLDRLDRELAAFAAICRTPAGRGQRGALATMILQAIETTIPPHELKLFPGHPDDEQTMERQRLRRKRTLAAAGRRVAADWVRGEPGKAAGYVALARLELWDEDPIAAARQARAGLEAEPKSREAAELLKRAEILLRTMKLDAK